MYVLPYGQMSLWGFLIKPQIYNICLFLFSLVLIVPLDFDITSKVSRLKGILRIGPHNKDVLSIIFGSLLGDAYAEKRAGGLGTRIIFYQEAVHVEYLYYLHKLFSNLGYCNPKIPVVTSRLGPKGKLRQIVRFRTWTYTSFNWVQELWYKNNIKQVQANIAEYLTPLALAIWIMDDGCKVGKGLKFSTNSFSYNECLILVKALNDNFNLKASVQSAGSNDQHVIYIWKESMNDLRNIVSPYIIPEMKYKII